jgi:hypothetical protein
MSIFFKEDYDLDMELIYYYNSYYVVMFVYKLLT